MPADLKKIDETILMKSPERQYKFVLIYCSAGDIKIEIDSVVYQIHNGQFLTITPKQFYQFIELNGSEGFVLEFTYDFFCKDDKAIELIYHNGLFCHFGLNEIVRLPYPEYANRIEDYFSTIENELTTQSFEADAYIHSIIKLLIIEVSRCKIIQQQRPLYKPNALFLEFLGLVRENFEKRLTVSEYAARLNITEPKLNELAKTITGETSQQLINDLIILEARRLFKYENLNVKQVAFKLGFDDPHYFSRFFKKQTDTRARDHLRSMFTE
jgi:AraC family transcriptional regulator, transcriptional activator of pobA